MYIKNTTNNIKKTSGNWMKFFNPFNKWVVGSGISRLIVTFLLLIASSNLLFAATFTVSNNNNSGNGSLRDAIANMTSRGDTIDFNLSSGNETIIIASSLSNNPDNITINGDNVKGSGTNVRVEVTNPSVSSYHTIEQSNISSLVLKNLVLIGGKADWGGVINAYHVSSLTLENCTVKHGVATYIGGGGIYFTGGTGTKMLTIKNCTISDNKGTKGGGLYCRDSDDVTIKNSTFKENNIISRTGGGAFFKESDITITQTNFVNNNNNTNNCPKGGGLFAKEFSPGERLVITNSTFNGNDSEASGGGLYCRSQRVASGGATLTNCTFYNNNTGRDGGAIYLREGTHYVTNVTVVNNSVTSSRAKNTAEGLHIRDGNLYIQNSLLANNNSGDFSDYNGDIVDNGSNIVESSYAYTFDPNKNKTGNQANLNIASSLARNSTAFNTQTVALNSGSVATNAGDLSDNGAISVPSVDQRGFGTNGKPDIGAFERSGNNPHVWTSGGKSWSNAGNWDESTAPGSGDIAIVTEKTNTPSITANQTVEAVIINIGGKLSISNAKTLTVEEDFTNNGHSDVGNGSLKLSGSSPAQAIKGFSEIIVGDLEMDNPNGIQMETNVEVQNNLDFQNGTLEIPNNHNAITLTSGASVTNYDSSQYIAGKVTKKGSGPFTFPVGDGGSYARIEIANPSVMNYAFTAEYHNNQYSDTSSFASSSNNPNNNPKLNNVSTFEFLTLNPESASQSADVTLYWEGGSPTGSGFTQLSGLVIAHWNNGASIWENLGQSSNTGSASSSGSVTVTGVSNFSPFTFGSTSSSNNPLPVELLYFQGKSANDYVDLSWSTASETNNRHFKVQKQIEGEWVNMGTVEGNGTTIEKQTYSFQDGNVKSNLTYYYRLKQVDFDGSYEYSDVKVVNVTGQASDDNRSLAISPSPVTANSLRYKLRAGDQEFDIIRIINMRGTVIQERFLNSEKTASYSTLNLQGIKPGVYIVQLRGEDNILHQRFIRQ